MTKADEKWLDTFLHKCLRRIFKVHWPMRVPTDEIRRRAGIEKISTQVRRRRWKWIGHVLRWHQTETHTWHYPGHQVEKEVEDGQGKHGGELWRGNALSWDLHRGPQQQLCPRIGTDGEHLSLALSPTRGQGIKQGSGHFTDIYYRARIQ